MEIDNGVLVVAGTGDKQNQIAARKVESKPSGDVKSALRVIDVLDLLGRWHGERTHNQIAEELNIPKSSLTQILRTLVRHEYLTYLADTRGYTLGVAIDKLAKQSRTTRDLTAVAEPVLQWMTETTSESSALNYMNGDELEVVATVISPQRIVAHLRLGDRAPMHTTSGGQVILAFLTPSQLDAYLKRVHFVQFARNTLMSVEAVRTKLDRIRADGFAVVNEEFTPGMGGVARPVFGPGKIPLASLSLTMPVNRLDKACLEEAGLVLDRAVTSLQHRAGLI